FSLERRPTISVRRLNSPLILSIELLECSLARLSLGKHMSAKRSCSASSMMVVSLIPRGRIWSVTARHCTLAASAVPGGKDWRVEGAGYATAALAGKDQEGAQEGPGSADIWRKNNLVTGNG